MMKKTAEFSVLALAILVAAFYLPEIYRISFLKPVQKTHLLYSPVTKRFIYSEKVVGPAPEEARSKSEDHHAEIMYRDADGAFYSRVEFEKRLPFIYYKNMELWGLLPLMIDGQSFDKDSIQTDRMVLELKSEDITGRHRSIPLRPLLESNPGQARLVFPEEWFRMTDNVMEFIHADTTRVIPDMTRKFTAALLESGFVFPARSVHGRVTILKPFDEGVFIVDAGYRVFHVKRRNGSPVVVNTGIDPAIQTRHIQVSENEEREYHGLLLSGDGALHLLTCAGYGLIRLPLEYYNPDGMDFKLITDPIYRTAVWSDDTVIRAVVMDLHHRPLERFTHTMSRATVTMPDRIQNMLFPYRLVLDHAKTGFGQLSIQWGGWWYLPSVLFCLAGYGAAFAWRHRRLPPMMRLCWVAVGGIYGWIALGALESDN